MEQPDEGYKPTGAYEPASVPPPEPTPVPPAAQHITPATNDRFEQRLILLTIGVLGAVVILSLIATVILLLQGKEADAVAPLATGGMGALAPSPLSKSATRPRGGGS